MNTHCPDRHALSPGISNPSGESTSRFCDICLRNIHGARLVNIHEDQACLKNLPDDKAGVMSCGVCNIDVCGSCVNRHAKQEGSDTGLMIRLRRTKAFGDPRMTLYDVYRQHPEFARELYRNPSAAGVYWEGQRFHLTDEYEVLLTRDLESAREEFVIAQAKVGKAEDTLAEFRHARARLDTQAGHDMQNMQGMDIDEDSHKRKRDDASLNA